MEERIEVNEQRPSPTAASGTGDAAPVSPDDVIILPGHADGDWLTQWQALPQERRDQTEALVREILLLKAKVTRSNCKQKDRKDESLRSLEKAGTHLVMGGNGSVASALIETVHAFLEEERKIREAQREHLFSTRSALMLGIGVGVQGIFAGIVFGSLALFSGGVPFEILGVKTISLLTVLAGSIAGSLARVVRESQVGEADEDTLQSWWSMIATSAARPILAAVLALFVFALFQCGLVGIPFEADGSPTQFGPEDFFFLAIAFVIGFNDTLGLNLLAYVGKYLPDANDAPIRSGLSTATNVRPQDVTRRPQLGGGSTNQLTSDAIA